MAASAFRWGSLHVLIVNLCPFRASILFPSGALYDDRLLLNTCKIELRTAIKKTYPKNYIQNMSKPYDLRGGASATGAAAAASDAGAGAAAAADASAAEKK